MRSLNLDIEQHEMLPYLESIHGILSWLKPDGLGGRESGVLVDYGCGWGTWSLAASDIYRSVIGLDVLDPQLDWGRRMAQANGLENVRFVNSLRESESAIPKMDAMIAIGFMPVAQGDHVHQMFDFAKRHLVSGGRFLILAYRPVAFIDQVASLEYFFFLSPIQALRRYAVTARSALETLYGPKIADTSRARAYHARSGMIELGTERQMRLAAAPDELANLNFFRDLDVLFKGDRYRRRFQWADWYLFEAP
jgi:precorrin-6B methylase 2